jgi:outer membrane receptor protein involved in Fe transport
VGQVHAETTFGAQLRDDDISNGLFPTSDLERTGVVREDEVGQTGLGFHGDTWLRFSEALRVNLGLRLDYYGADVEAVSLPFNSGSADAWMLKDVHFHLVVRPSVRAALVFRF